MLPRTSISKLQELVTHIQPSRTESRITYPGDVHVDHAAPLLRQIFGRLSFPLGHVVDLCIMILLQDVNFSVCDFDLHNVIQEDTEGAACVGITPRLSPQALHNEVTQAAKRLNSDVSNFLSKNVAQPYTKTQEHGFAGGVLFASHRRYLCMLATALYPAVEGCPQCQCPQMVTSVESAMAADATHPSPLRPAAATHPSSVPVASDFAARKGPVPHAALADSYCQSAKLKGCELVMFVMGRTWGAVTVAASANNMTGIFSIHA
ncbi:hypothetical protein IQ07DRAFT_316730 [Pyrenochaeta sp. DS3sAY3a]|nr:hypothetical protein IQ07DRAFT_316730 [Pyrenochaeta sp. DS3sAY3a]